jgi:uncharacterized surface protein with fasciclin (FAS1) repeats
MRRPRSPRVAALLAGLGLLLAACANKHPTVAVSGEPRQPASPDRIPAVLEADQQQRFTTLLACAELAGLTTTLSGTGPMTLFAPTNDAFASAGISCKATDTPSAEAKTTLNRTLLQHILDYDVALTPPPDFDPAKPTRGFVLVGIGTVTLPSELTDNEFASLQINGSAKTVQRVNGPDVARILGDGVHAPNGYVYAIDKVIVPAPPDAVPPSTTLPKPYE